jgi:hypothetical protein
MTPTPPTPPGDCCPADDRRRPPSNPTPSPGPLTGDQTPRSEMLPRRIWPRVGAAAAALAEPAQAPAGASDSSSRTLAARRREVAAVMLLAVLVRVRRRVKGGGCWVSGSEGVFGWGVWGVCCGAGDGALGEDGCGGGAAGAPVSMGGTVGVDMALTVGVVVGMEGVDVRSGVGRMGLGFDPGRKGSPWLGGTIDAEGIEV